MALTNKVITIINTSKSIDVKDMLSTIVAEIIIFSIPVLQKEKILKKQNNIKFSQNYEKYNLIVDRVSKAYNLPIENTGLKYVLI